MNRISQFITDEKLEKLYVIDLDERGSFLAHVENKNGKAVFNIKAGNELKEDESSIFEDGWMKHKEDIDGLEKYLKQLRIIRQDDWVTMDENELSGSTSISGTPRINRLPRYYIGISISSGTLESEVLIQNFMKFLDSVKKQTVIGPRLQEIQLLLDKAKDDEERSSILNEDIFSLMDDIAPPGSNFGAHPGEGSDFGFWGDHEEDLRGLKKKSMFAGPKKSNMETSKKEKQEKTESLKKNKDLEKFSGRSDDLNPKFIFSLTATQILCEALKGEFDIEYLVRKELANRGVDEDGRWVGFDKAKEIHKI
ncbi:MAG: hypothetical protein J0H92_17930 [Sphingobacteriales bacterium]|nr:hypothetical protein [Sphingobacteriales bacterium]